MTGYKVIELPFPELLASPEPHRVFSAMTPDQAQRFYDWFVGEIPSRVAELERAVRANPGLASWAADLTPGSLDSLGEWFARTVTTRPVFPGENGAIYQTGPEWFRSVKLEEWNLTDETFSLCYDIGMYLGRVMEENLPGVHWIRVTKPKNLMEYNMTALAGFAAPAVDTVGLAQSIAYGVARGKTGGARLREVYDIWAGHADCRRSCPTPPGSRS